jgi:hypothetical protein
LPAAVSADLWAVHSALHYLRVLASAAGVDHARPVATAAQSASAPKFIVIGHVSEIFERGFPGQGHLHREVSAPSVLNTHGYA